MDRYDEQLRLEEEMRDLGRDAFRSRVEDAQKAGRETQAQHGRLMLRGCIDPLSEGISAFVKKAYEGGAGRRHSAARLIKDVDPDIAAFITARQVLDNISKRKKMQQLAIQIGKAIEDNQKWIEFEKLNAPLFHGIRRQLSSTRSDSHRHAVLTVAMNRIGVEWEGWTPTEKLHVGTKMIELMIERTNLVTLELVPEGKNKTVYYLTPTDRTKALILEKNEAWEMLCPRLLPMIVPPLPWSTPYDGGYLHPMIRRANPLVKTHNKNYLAEIEASPAQMGHVYEAVNTVQNTAWKINAPLLNAMQAMWDAGGVVGNMPPRDDYPLPTKPLNIAEDEDARRVWRKAAAEVHNQNRTLRSRRVSMALILWVAEKYRQYETIWFPYSLDFRGRIYAIPRYLSPQGQDESKALLTFAKGKPIVDETAADWLRVHGANLWGEDKVSMIDRAQWTKDNADWIYLCGKQPLEYTEWTQADGGNSAWQFLAFCIEYAGFMDEGFGFVSSLPLHMDGSCNGLQHFSALLRDPVGGAATNLVPSAVPSDIYQQVADRTVEKLKEIAARATDPTAKLASTELEEAVLAGQWLELGVGRKVCKRPVMVLPYGGTKYSCREYVQDWIEKDSEGAPWEEFFQPSQFLAGLIWESIGEVVVAAREVMAMLQKWAQMAGKEGLPVTWTTPDGFPVLQAYTDTRQQRVKTKIGDQVMKLTLHHSTNKIDKLRQANGISPNFVHSLDATAARMYVTMAADNGIESFALIHDSFGTCAADTELSRRCIRHSFVDMYADNEPLSALRKDIEEIIPDERKPDMPVVPDMLGLDIEQVRRSEYFFA